MLYEVITRPVDRIECIMVTALTVLCLMVYDAVLYFDLTCGEVTLEICHIVLGVPEAPLQERKEPDTAGELSVVPEGETLHFAVIAHRNEEEHLGTQIILLCPDDGITYPVTA